MSPGFPMGPGGPNRGAGRIDPADRRQLDEAPVSARRILTLFAPHLRPLGVVTALIVATSLLGVANPFLIKAIIDDALPHQNVRLLIIAVAAMITITVITSIFGVIQTYLSTRVGQTVMHGLRVRVFDHLQRQSLAFFTRTRGGEIQSRITQDIAGMQSVVTTTATSIASNLTAVVATAVAMIALSPKLSLLSLIVIPPAIWTTRKVALMRRRVTAAQQRKLADLTSQVEEGLSINGVLLTKTLGAQQATSTRFAAGSNELIDLEIRSTLAGRWRMATMSIVFAAIPALIYLAAGLPVTGGGITIGTLIAFTTLQTAIFRPVMGLLDVAAQWVSSMALFSRIFAYLDLPVEVADPPQHRDLDPARVVGDVAIRNVSFRYPAPQPKPEISDPDRSQSDEPESDKPESADTWALSDVDLQIPAGSTLAVVGATGSGKTTLGSLLSRLADPTTGQITIDGVDLRDLDLEQVASIVGVVSQDTYLLHASIADNLRLARPEATEADLWQALAVAQAADLVAALPEGLDTMVGSRGYRFSGGEKQRLAVARTLLRDPPVLVLDEATSALDNQTERALQSALDSLSRGRTTITIAHRLSTIRDADQIAVLDQGRVVELGDHDTLLARDGRYAQLVRSAAQGDHLLPA